MDAEELLLITTDAPTREALAWLALARESFDQYPSVAIHRHLRRPVGEPLAVTHVGAIALRTNDADALMRSGVDILLGISGRSVEELQEELTAECPSDLHVLWDSPAWELARRHGLGYSVPRLSAADHEHLNRLNEIRTRALHHTVPLLLSSFSDGERSEFEVRVLEPGWAVLQAIALHNEAEHLTALGAVPSEEARWYFRAAASTAVRAYREFPEECSQFFSAIAQRRDDLDDIIDPTWQAFLTDIVQRFVTRAGTNRALLLELEDGNAGLEPGARYTRARDAITTLARDTGVWCALDRSSFQGPHLTN